MQLIHNVSHKHMGGVPTICQLPDSPFKVFVTNVEDAPGFWDLFSHVNLADSSKEK